MHQTHCFKLLALPLALAAAGSAHATHWGAWSEGSSLRPPGFHERLLAGTGAPGARPAVPGDTSGAPETPRPSRLAAREGPTLDVRMSDGTRLVSATSGLSYDPTTGATLGPIDSSGSGAGAGAAFGAVGLAVHQGFEPFLHIFFPGVASVSELDGVSPASGDPTSLVTDYGVTLDKASGGANSQTGSDSVTQLKWGAITGGYTQSGTMPSAYTSGVNTTDVLYAYGPVASAMPTTGTFAYTVLGSVVRDTVTGLANGTLNSASLSINFTDATANYAVSASAGGATFTATANAIPVGTFNVSTGAMPPPVTTTAWSASGPAMVTAACTTGCTAGTTIDAFIFGRVTGAGASGAITAFRIGANSSSAGLTQGVSGVVTFKK